MLLPFRHSLIHSVSQLSRSMPFSILQGEQLKYPHPNPSISFWLQGTRSSSLLGHRSSTELPETADVVIIGSGLSGAAIAYFLLTGQNPPKSVIIIEAREACTGATGRNGGHCRPDCYRGTKHSPRMIYQLHLHSIQDTQATRKRSGRRKHLKFLLTRWSGVYNFLSESA